MQAHAGDCESLLTGDDVENYTEPIVEGFFDSITDACGGVAPRFCNVQDGM